MKILEFTFPNDLQILHGALFIFRHHNFLENCHVGAIPNSSSPVHLHWHIERISGCNHLMLRHWHFSLLWTTKLSGLRQEFTWNTWVIMKSWDLFEDDFCEKKSNIQTIVYQLFICTCTRIQSRNTYSVQCSSSWNKFPQQLSSKKIDKFIQLDMKIKTRLKPPPLTFQRFISTNK